MNYFNTKPAKLKESVYFLKVHVIDIRINVDIII